MKTRKKSVRLKFLIPIGDWSNDGHGKVQQFAASANARSIDVVREAYFVAKKKHPKLCPESFCDGYQDSGVPDEVVVEAEQLGLTINPSNFWTQEMAAYVVWFLNLGNPNLKVRLDRRAEPVMLPFYGYDRKKRHISFIGYGLFND